MLDLFVGVLPPHHMIDETAFYHGAALVRLLDDSRCATVRKHPCGYVVNDALFVYLKYTTKKRGPWGFSASGLDLARLAAVRAEFSFVCIGLVCGGDGVCAVSAPEFEAILGGSPGWVSVRRQFHKRYTVSGAKGALDRKVAMQRWPTLLFAETSEVEEEAELEETPTGP
ncbi:MAG: hypothetical protein ABR961_13515 [Thermoanaerobaculaceae bacterium]